MAQHARNYAVTAFVTLAAACASFVITQKQPSVSFDARPDALATAIGDWHGRNIPLDAATRSAFSADRVLLRDYTNSETGRQVTLLIVYRKYGRRGFAHRPERCYPAAGWEILSTSDTLVPYHDDDVQARYVEAGKDGGRAVVTYWFASGRRTESSYVRQQARMAFDRLHRRKYGWAFISVDVSVTRDRDEAHRVTQSFLRDIENPLSNILTGE